MSVAPANSLLFELRRIGRKARRYSTRNKTGKPAVFKLCTKTQPGIVLLSNLEGTL